MDLTYLVGGEIRSVQTEWVQVRITGQPSITLPPPGTTDTWLTAADGGGTGRATDLYIRSRRREETLSSFSVNSLRLTYLVSRLPTYFGNLQNMLPPKRLVFYLWHMQGNALPKLLATLSTCSPLCERHKLTSKQFIKILDGSLPTHSKKTSFAFFWCQPDRNRISFVDLNWSQSRLNHLPLANEF